MPATKPVSDAFTADRIMPAAMVEEGMQMVKAQLAATTVLPQKIWETQFAITSEILAFLGRRMQAQAEFCAKLGHCKEIGEAVDAQQDPQEHGCLDRSRRPIRVGLDGQP